METEPTLNDSSSSIGSSGSTGLITVEAPTVSRLRKIVRALGWGLFAILCLVTFTVFKLPETRIKNFIQGSISSALSAKGMTFSAGKSSLSFFFGISYDMRDITINLPPPESPVHIDRIEVAPSLLSLVLGRIGGKLWVYNGDGDLKASFSIKSTAAANEMSLSFKASELNLGKLGLLPIAAGLKGSMILTGDGSLSGDLSQPPGWTGELHLALSKIVLEQQAIAGFSVPRLAISEGAVELGIDKTKATIKSFKLGKPGNAADDITANVSGEVLLARALDASTLNLKARFSLSQNILKSFVLIDALLGNGKQADGSYAFALTGPVGSPNSAPLGAQ